MMLRPPVPGRTLVAVATTGRPSIIVVSPERLGDFRGRPAVHQGGVAAGDAIPGMGEPVNRVSVTGEQEEAGGHHIEPTHVGQSGPVSNEVEDRTPALFILGGGDNTERLVEGEPAVADSGMSFAADGNPMAIRIDLGAELRRDLPIDLDPAIRDQRFRGATTCDSRPRQRPLEAHLGHDSAGTDAAASSSPSAAMGGREAGERR